MSPREIDVELKKLTHYERGHKVPDSKKSNTKRQEDINNVVRCPCDTHGSDKIEDGRQA